MHSHLTSSQSRVPTARLVVAVHVQDAAASATGITASVATSVAPSSTFGGSSVGGRRRVSSVSNHRRRSSAVPSSVKATGVVSAANLVGGGNGPASPSHRRASNRSQLSASALVNKTAAVLRSGGGTDAIAQAHAANAALAPILTPNVAASAKGYNVSEAVADAKEITDVISNSTGVCRATRQMMHVCWLVVRLAPRWSLCGHVSACDDDDDDGDDDGDDDDDDADVYTRIFAQPTAVQTALRKPGKERGREDVKAIAQMLRALDFFRTMPPRSQAKFCKVPYNVVSPLVWMNRALCPQSEVPSWELPMCACCVGGVDGWVCSRWVCATTAAPAVQQAHVGGVHLPTR